MRLPTWTHGWPYLEQHLINELSLQTNPILVAGDSDWNDYAVEVRLKPLSLAEIAGVIFRYHTNRHYYAFALTHGREARLAMRVPLDRNLRMAEWGELGTREFPYDGQKYYARRVENDGPRIRALIDGNLVIKASDSELVRGKVGVTANIPARFQEFQVTASTSATNQMRNRVSRREAQLSKRRAENPQPTLWQKFETPRYGAGRSVQFGDLDGDGHVEMLLAQNIARVRGHGFDQISCVTAVTLEGRVLWQSGRPDPRNGLLTNDLPFQIHDIDGDGPNEVVLVKDFRLQVWEGGNGKLKQWVWMPKMPSSSSPRPYEFENGDAIAFLNLSGDEKRREILVKDRYHNFWIFTQHLELLWQGQGQTGHFPYPFDMDGDGRDEFLIGYSLWDHSGHRLWSHDHDLKDHADAVVMGKFSGDPHTGWQAYASGSDEGFLVFEPARPDPQAGAGGPCPKHEPGQVSPERTRSSAHDFKFLEESGHRDSVRSRWQHSGPGRTHSLGQSLDAGELAGRRTGICPALRQRCGRGMIDGDLQRAVLFPDDGHPDLCAYAIDVVGDERDEVILWDQERVWIYTQNRPFTSERIYAPVRNPRYNESNLRLDSAMVVACEIKRYSRALAALSVSKGRL